MKAFFKRLFVVLISYPLVILGYHLNFLSWLIDPWNEQDPLFLAANKLADIAEGFRNWAEQGAAEVE